MNAIKFVSVFVIGLLLLSPYSHASSTRCVTGVVQTISVGYGEADSGNGVRVTIRGKYYFMDESRNLNNKTGYALLSMLLKSKLTGIKVALYDHYGKRCDDFQEVVL